MASTPRPGGAIAIISLLVALPVAAIALWISLVEGAAIYKFIHDLRPNLSDADWGSIERCRVASRMLLHLALTQIMVGVAILWSIVRAARFTANVRRILVGVLWLVTGFSVALELYWIPRMLPAVSIEGGMSARQTIPPTVRRKSD